MKRFGGVIAYGMPRNLVTVALEDGRTVLIPINKPGPTTAVGAWFVTPVTELSSATKMTEALPDIMDDV